MIANHIAEAWKCKLMVLERQIGSLVDKLDLGPSNHISNKNCDCLNDNDLHRLMNLMLLLQLMELLFIKHQSKQYCKSFAFTVDVNVFKQ